MKKMSIVAQKAANGGYDYYCVCGKVLHTALTWNIHIAGCVYYQRLMG